MVSPIRGAREQVAVNIAVTGFVGRLLPSQTKELAKSMEALQSKIRDNKAEIKGHEAILRQWRREGKEGTEEYDALQKRVNDLTATNKGYSNTIANMRLEMRDLQAQTAANLNQIRGWGILLGIVALTLGGAAAATVKVSDEMRELEFVAYQTGVTMQSLQRDTHSFTVSLGNVDAARSAAQSLADFRYQLELLRTAPHLSSVNMAGLARAGINPFELVGLSTDALRGRLIQEFRRVRDDPRLRAELLSAIPPDLAKGVVSDVEGPAPSFRAPVLSQSELQQLAQARRDFGEFRVVLGRVAEVLTLSVGPALGTVFGIINTGLSPVMAFIGENKAAAIALGIVVVATMMVVGAIAVVVISYNVWRISSIALSATHTALNAKTFALSQRFWALLVPIKGNVLANLTLATSQKATTVASIAATKALALHSVTLQTVYRGTLLWNTALWLLAANPIVLKVLLISAALAAVGAGIYAIVRWRNQIWNFFDGWGRAVLLVLGPIGWLTFAIVSLIKHWERLQSIGRWFKGIFTFSAPNVTGGGTGGADGPGLISPRSPGAYIRPTNNNVDVRENVQISNTYNIQGSANAEQVAEAVSDNQVETYRRSTAGRRPAFQN